MIRLLLAIVLLPLIANAFGPGGLAQGEADSALKQAMAARQEYIRSFRDLTAVETWVTEVLRKDGTVAERRTVVSDFFVYHSRVDAGVIREYRITRTVDGRNSGDPVEQATKLFRALEKARTRQQEDSVLHRQNFKHIYRFSVWGFVVDPIPPVQEDRQKDFQFIAAGRQRLGDEEVVVLKYESKVLRPHAPDTIFKNFKNPRYGFQGTVWLAAKDGGLRRWVDDLVIEDDEIKTAAVLLHKEIAYQPSPVGLVPNRLAVSLFDRDRDKKTPELLRLSIRQSFSYEAFKRFDVATATEIKKLDQH